MTKIDIAQNRDVIDLINAILNNKGICEIKNESKGDNVNLVVVEISRSVKTKPKNK